MVHRARAQRCCKPGARDQRAAHTLDPISSTPPLSTIPSHHHIVFARKPRLLVVVVLVPVAAPEPLEEGLGQRVAEPDPSRLLAAQAVCRRAPSANWAAHRAQAVCRRLGPNCDVASLRVAALPGEERPPPRRARQGVQRGRACPAPHNPLWLPSRLSRRRPPAAAQEGPRDAGALVGASVVVVGS